MRAGCFSAHHDHNRSLPPEGHQPPGFPIRATIRWERSRGGCSCCFTRGKTKAAARLAEESGLPASVARVRLAQEDPCAALEILDWKGSPQQRAERAPTSDAARSGTPVWTGSPRSLPAPCGAPILYAVICSALSTTSGMETRDPCAQSVSARRVHRNQSSYRSLLTNHRSYITLHV
jgi:hypothetical protein